MLTGEKYGQAPKNVTDKQDASVIKVKMQEKNVCVCVCVCVSVYVLNEYLSSYYFRLNVYLRLIAH